MRDKYFTQHHIKHIIQKKVLPISITVFVIVISTLFMAIRDKSRAFNLLDFSVDKDWIHVILFNIIMLIYLYDTFIYPHTEKKTKE